MSLPALLVARRARREDLALGDGLSFTIVRDYFGNPTVVARSLEAATVGWGYACAADRFFQIAWMRRVLRGTLSALIGDRPLGDALPTAALHGARVSDLDVFARTLDFLGVARASLAACGPLARDTADRYARGINLYLDRHGLPLESRLVGDDPEPWRAEDCALLARAVGLMLTFSWRAAAAAMASHGHPGALDLRAHPPVPATAQPAEIGALVDLVRASLGAGPGAAASNAVAVAGSRSRTGAPLLAADPHMPLAAPAVFWEVALSTPELRVQGATVPGTPIVSMGQTAHTAWGVTSGWGDDSQLYLEPPDELEAASLRHVVIPRRGDKPRSVTVRTTERGPVVSDVLPRLRPPPGAPPSAAVSLRWVGLLPTRELDAAAATLRARTTDELREALAAHACPSINAVFADTRGEIGWQFAGWIPRRGAPGLALADARDPSARWEGFRTTRELPGCETPRAGVIVSSNTQPDGSTELTPVGEPPFRFLRWHELLRATPVVAPDDLAGFQRDVTSGWARECARLLAPRLDARYRRRLLEWDGHAHRGSNTAAVVYTTLRELALDAGAADAALAGTFDLVNAALLPFTRAVAARLAQSDGERVARAALARAERALGERLGPPDQWRWGALHRAHFPHVLAGSPVGALFRIPPVELGGDGTTVAMASFNLARGFDAEVGPSLRLVLDVARPDRSRGVLVPGASGHVRSPHYADQLELWREGKLRAMNGAFREWDGLRTRRG